MFIQKKSNRRGRIAADTEVAPEATDLLFEANDVADLVAEVTGEDVEVEANEDVVEFTVGEDTYVVEPEGDEEVLEASTRVPRNVKRIKASTRTAPKGRRVVRRR